MIRRLGAIAYFICAWTVAAALAQSSPGLRTGDIPTAQQWNSYFAAKQDFSGSVPLLPSQVAGQSPIVATLGGGVVVISCPTCASGSITLATNHILVGNGSNVATDVAMSGDCTIVASGAITCTKTNNVSFATSATTDATNASNISSGTLASARGGAGTITGALKGNGAGVTSQAACADLSNGAASCSTDATNASNIGSGTLNGARLSYASNSDIFLGVSSKPVDGNGLNTAGNTVTLTDAATIAVDMGTGINYAVTLGGNRTVGAPTNTIIGRQGCINIVQDGTGSRTIAFNAVWKFPGGAAPVATTTAGAVDMVCYWVIDPTHIQAIYNNDIK